MQWSKAFLHCLSECCLPLSQKLRLVTGLLQRVVLLSYNKGTNKISFRHYSILAQPCGVTKGVKALINKRQIPNLGNFQDISDFVTKSGYGSVSLTSLRSD